MSLFDVDLFLLVFTWNHPVPVLILFPYTKTFPKQIEPKKSRGFVFRQRIRASKGCGFQLA